MSLYQLPNTKCLWNLSQMAVDLPLAKFLTLLLLLFLQYDEKYIFIKIIYSHLFVHFAYCIIALYSELDYDSFIYLTHLFPI